MREHLVVTNSHSHAPLSTALNNEMHYQEGSLKMVTFNFSMNTNKLIPLFGSEVLLGLMSLFKVTRLQRADYLCYLFSTNSCPHKPTLLPNFISQLHTHKMDFQKHAVKMWCPDTPARNRCIQGRTMLASSYM